MTYTSYRVRRHFVQLDSRGTTAARFVARTSSTTVSCQEWQSQERTRASHTQQVGHCEHVTNENERWQRKQTRSWNSCHHQIWAIRWAISSARKNGTFRANVRTFQTAQPIIKSKIEVKNRKIANCYNTTACKTPSLCTSERWEHRKAIAADCVALATINGGEPR